MKNLSVVVHFLGALLSVRGEAAPTIRNCVPFVKEFGTLNCTCYTGDCTSDRNSLFWVNQTIPSAGLTVPTVRRQDNGTKYVCRLDCGDTSAFAVYTLIVAYGPSEDTMSIEGNASIVLDKITRVNLTCVATDVNPAPLYSWLDPLCGNHSQGATCIFLPKQADDGQTVTCRASNNPASLTAEKRLRLNLMYPPENGPVILIGNGTLTCTVTGGKPLVSTVIFNCSTPLLSDQADTRNLTSVSSVQIIGAALLAGRKLYCACKAEWLPQYKHMYTTTVMISSYPVSTADDESSRNMTIAYAIISTSVGLCLVVAVGLLVRHYTKKRAGSSSVRQMDTRNTDAR